MLAIAAGATISDVCQQIEQVQGSPVRLFRRNTDGTGVEMRGPQPVFDTTGVGNEHEVPMFEILQTPRTEFEVKIMAGATFSVWVKPSHTMCDDKQRLQQAGIQVFYQQLMFAGHKLQNGKHGGTSRVEKQDALI